MDRGVPGVHVGGSSARMRGSRQKYRGQPQRPSNFAGGHLRDSARRLYPGLPQQSGGHGNVQQGHESCHHQHFYVHFGGRWSERAGTGCLQCGHRCCQLHPHSKFGTQHDFYRHHYHHSAADTFGNTLAANFVWTFTTSAACPAPSSGLGTACSFGILGGSTVTNVVGTATTVSGDVGVWPGSAITGFGAPASITGTTHAGDATAQTAQGDLTTAYNNAAGAAGGAVLPPDIGGVTLFPGVYKTTSAQPSLGITGNLTLDAQGDPNALWIFQIVSTLDTAAGNSQVLLIGGATSHNVIWQVGSSATLGTNTIFEGTIMAQASVTVTTGATLNGRALARTGAVTLDTNTVVVPSCP